jgi:hypothetical protein
MTRLFALFIILALLIGMQPVGRAQDTGGFICPGNTVGGLALTGGGVTVTGDALCVYGPVTEISCPPVTLDGRYLSKQVVRPNGSVRCVYAIEGALQ